jgi:hypothetical protein
VDSLLLSSNYLQKTDRETIFKTQMTIADAMHHGQEQRLPTADPASARTVLPIVEWWPSRKAAGDIR